MNDKINRDKVVFINLTEMDAYNGPEPNLKGGGAFVEQHGYGHEIFNFYIDNGKCYGYTTPWGKLDLSRISKVINKDALGKYIDDVFVVFTCTRTGEGRVICGFYNNARVYSENVNDERASRKFEVDGKEVIAGYNIICSSSDAILIDRVDRKKLLPHATRNNGVGHGQHSVWYADNEERQSLKNELLDYIESFVNQAYSSDEHKYHKHDESKSVVVSSRQIIRSQSARNECIRRKGCYCNICGFDFEKTYGELGKGYIEVHHITPIGELSTAEGYEGTNVEKDLMPLCSNCHSLIHRRKPPYQPDDIKKLLET